MSEEIKRSCPQCGTDFPLANRPSKTFCSRRCKERAHHRSETGKRAHNARSKAFRQTEHGKEISRQITRRQTAKFPEKYRARRKVRTALESGLLVKPTCCQRCGAAKKLDAHHHRGYGPEHALDVVWLCRACHAREEAICA